MKNGIMLLTSFIFKAFNTSNSSATYTYFRSFFKKTEKGKTHVAYFTGRLGGYVSYMFILRLGK